MQNSTDNTEKVAVNTSIIPNEESNTKKEESKTTTKNTETKTETKPEVVKDPEFKSQFRER